MANPAAPVTQLVGTGGDLGFGTHVGIAPKSLCATHRSVRHANETSDPESVRTKMLSTRPLA